MDTNKIRLQLERKYFNTKGFCKAACKKLGEEGYNCFVDNSDHIIINGEEYVLEKWNMNYESPLQEAVFQKI